MGARECVRAAGGRAKRVSVPSFRDGQVTRTAQPKAALRRSAARAVHRASRLESGSSNGRNADMSRALRQRLQMAGALLLLVDHVEPPTLAAALSESFAILHEPLEDRLDRL